MLGEVPCLSCGLRGLPEGADVYERPSVRGVCLRDGQALMLQLGYGGYGFPGGGIEPGESHGDALRREMREETGYAVTKVGNKLGVVIWQCPQRGAQGRFFRQENHLYFCDLSDEPVGIGEYSQGAGGKHRVVWVDPREALAVNAGREDRARDGMALRLVLGEG
jgi:8-oxo-dGTP pyrophosphatase MutT (NUDIX family)